MTYRGVTIKPDGHGYFKVERGKRTYIFATLAAAKYQINLWAQSRARELDVPGRPPG